MEAVNFRCSFTRCSVKNACVHIKKRDGPSTFTPLGTNREKRDGRD